jgi:hypothetical protein
VIVAVVLIGIVGGGIVIFRDQIFGLDPAPADTHRR